METIERIQPLSETLEDLNLLDERIHQCLHDYFTNLIPPEQLRDLILRQATLTREIIDCRN